MSEREYWLSFSAFVGIGPSKFNLLLKQFKTAEKAWNAKSLELEEIGLKKSLVEKFEKFRKEFSIEKYLQQLKSSPAGEVWYITLEDEEYPKLLSEIKNPPFVLYGKGNQKLLNENKTIGIVGSRKTTQYGREVTKLLTQDLVFNGFTIVSGLAMGVDAISHMTSLENEGKTIAVLGCGVDCCFPTENQSVYENIIKKGSVVISEFPLSAKPAKWTFPARNRIIAGLSQAVLVTEGTEDSGSLITAEFALKFGRKVFAVPGPITSGNSKGPYKLISKGAKLVTSAEDILKELEISDKKKETRRKKELIGDTEEENLILKILENEPLHIDEIIRKSGLHSSQIGSILSIMEIKGFIKSMDGGVFSL